MKLRMMLLLIVPIAALAAEQKDGGKKPQSKGKEGVVDPLIPAGAKEIAPLTYRYTDPEGKTWIYRRTPFGLVKHEEKQEEKVQSPEEAAPNDWKAVEEGDSVRFERRTPFGVVRWVRKKTELNEAEQAAWERERRKRADKAASPK